VIAVLRATWHHHSWLLMCQSITRQAAQCDVSDKQLQRHLSPMQLAANVRCSELTVPAVDTDIKPLFLVTVVVGVYACPTMSPKESFLTQLQISAACAHLLPLLHTRPLPGRGSQRQSLWQAHAGAPDHQTALNVSRTERGAQGRISCIAEHQIVPWRSINMSY
jgi:hypothetical protein